MKKNIFFKRLIKKKINWFHEDKAYNLQKRGLMMTYKEVEEIFNKSILENGIILEKNKLSQLNSLQMVGLMNSLDDYLSIDLSFGDVFLFMSLPKNEIVDELLKIIIERRWMEWKIKEMTRKFLQSQLKMKIKLNYIVRKFLN